jgi:hypothetical protein
MSHPADPHGQRHAARHDDGQPALPHVGVVVPLSPWRASLPSIHLTNGAAVTSGRYDEPFCDDLADRPANGASDPWSGRRRWLTVTASPRTALACAVRRHEGAPPAQESTMTGTMMPIGDWSDHEPTSADERAGAAGNRVDAVLDSLYDDVAAVTRGLVEIKRLADHLEATLR